MPRADFAAVTATIALAPYFAPSSLAVALQDGLEGADWPCAANIGNRTWASRKDANARKVKRDCALSSPAWSVLTIAVRSWLPGAGVWTAGGAASAAVANASSVATPDEE